MDPVLLICFGSKLIYMQFTANNVYRYKKGKIVSIKLSAHEIIAKGTTIKIKIA
jgi:GMP synthase-like glutamine amidotransferase